MDNQINHTTDSRKVLLQTLTVAGYKGNKESYADKFLDLCYQETLLSLLESLPEDKQKEIQEQLKEKPEAKTINDILKDNFTTEKIFETSQAVAEKAFGDVIAKLMRVLKDDQKEKLTQYLDSLKKDEKPTS